MTTLLVPEHWGLLYQVEEECGSIPMVLVQNKVDLLEDAAVSR